MDQILTSEIPEFKILIVDDIPANIDILSKTLEPQGYSISAALEGEKALKIAYHLHPDLILLDIMMENMDGFEVCRKLKQDPATSHIPVIFISALDNVESVLKGFRAGAVDYVTKPFHQEEVLARVQTHLQLHHLEQQKKELIEILEAKNKDLLKLNELKNLFLGVPPMTCATLYLRSRDSQN